MTSADGRYQTSDTWVGEEAESARFVVRDMNDSSRKIVFDLGIDPNTGAGARGAGTMKVTENGDLQALNAEEEVVWRSNTGGNNNDGNFELQLTNDGERVLIDTSVSECNRELWSSEGLN